MNLNIKHKMTKLLGKKIRATSSRPKTRKKKFSNLIPKAQPIKGKIDKIGAHQF